MGRFLNCASMENIVTLNRQTDRETDKKIRYQWRTNIMKNKKVGSRIEMVSFKVDNSIHQADTLFV